jgi:glycerophosphoryl diester phosphodiesterase
MISQKIAQMIPKLIPQKISGWLPADWSDVMSQLLAQLISVEPWPDQALILPRLQAHRGYWLGGAQENTLAAFREAKKRGALMVECDVQLSKDRIPIVFHDVDLKRLAGVEKKVAELKASELHTLANVPTLRELLTDSGSPRFVNIELKSRIKLDDALERKVAEVVRSLKAENRVLFSSFNPFSLYRMSLHLPNVPRALLVSPSPDEDNHFLLRKMLLAPLISFHCLNLDQAMVDEKSLRLWKSRKIPVAVWTVNGSENIQKHLKLGAISVITDTL